MASELTIVIPAKNEAKLIPRLLTALTMQDYSKMSSTRVLVADANSTDGTPEIVLGFRDRLNVSVIRGGMPSVGRNLGAKPWYLISRIAIPSALPHTFVGLFMGLYYSFAVLVVAEILGAKYGLGWYIQFQTNYSGYANVYATLAIMSLLCAGLVKLLFSVRDRLLVWQKGFIR